MGPFAVGPLAQLALAKLAEPLDSAESLPIILFDGRDEAFFDTCREQVAAVRASGPSRVVVVYRPPAALSLAVRDAHLARLASGFDAWVIGPGAEQDETSSLVTIARAIVDNVSKNNCMGWGDLDDIEDMPRSAWGTLHAWSLHWPPVAEAVPSSVRAAMVSEPTPLLLVGLGVHESTSLEIVSDVYGAVHTAGPIECTSRLGTVFNNGESDADTIEVALIILRPVSATEI